MSISGFGGCLAVVLVAGVLVAGLVAGLVEEDAAWLATPRAWAPDAVPQLPSGFRMA